MVNVWAILTSSLATPDDQGKDWYSWITNQLGHAMLGLLLGGGILLIGGGWFWALAANAVAAGTKETYDLLSPRLVGWAAFRDGWQDWAFWQLGGLLAAAIFEKYPYGFGLALLGLIALAATGVWPRAIRAYKSMYGS